MAKRVLIIGNGIIGLSSALAALQRGMDVTILDRNTLEGAPSNQDTKSVPKNHI